MLLHMQNKRYPKNCYKTLKALDEAGGQNWFSKVCNLLFTYRFGYIWIAQDVGDIGMVISQFKIAYSVTMNIFRKKLFSF